MDTVDERILASLRRNARASISELSMDLKLSRTTVRSRLDRLVADGQIVGFTVVTKADVAQDPIRALTTIGIEGRGTDRVMRTLSGYAEVRAIHATNGRWDIIVELGTDDLATLDAVLTKIRRLVGVATSETSLLLATTLATRSA